MWGGASRLGLRPGSSRCVLCSRLRATCLNSSRLPYPRLPFALASQHSKWRPTGTLCAGIRRGSTGWTVLWDGYSLVGFDGGNLGGGRSGGAFDLGGPGSCVPKFYPVPFVECGGQGSTYCEFNDSEDYGYWLTTSTADTGSLSLSTAKNSYVSRCRVYEAAKSVLVRHSMTTSTPPASFAGYSKLWDGYSYIGYNGGSGGGVQDLSSPGSCLPVYLPTPILECLNPTACNNITNYDQGYWLTSLSQEEGSTTTVAGSKGWVSRCAVYAK